VSDPPLARLFAMGYRHLVEQLHERLRDRGWHDVRPAFGFALLAARDGGTTASELAELMGTSKQAAAKLVASMIDAGYLEVGVVRVGEDARRRPLHLTRRGVRLLDTVEAIYDELEAEWAAVIGQDAIARLRRDLAVAVAATNGGELPPVRPTW
jgi:DNA-binding MarR family transcriptional regulator